jgi:hypothetical protein
MGAIPWSPQFQKLRDRLLALILLWQKAAGVKVSTRFLERSLKRANLESAREWLKENLSSRRRQAYQEQWKITSKQSARQGRMSFLQSLAEAQAEESQLDKEQIYCQLMEQERI